MYSHGYVSQDERTRGDLGEGTRRERCNTVLESRVGGGGGEGEREKEMEIGLGGEKRRKWERENVKV